MLKLILLLPFLLLVNCAAGQVKNEVELSRAPDLKSTIKSLRIGDKVPDLLIPKIINYPGGNAKITDFKDRLIILDFWDTFCSSCIQALPKLDTMQQTFGSKVMILPLTWQKEQPVLDFFKNNGYIKKHKVNLPCVVEDKILRAYFKHQLVSHIVWIYKGVVRAITTSEYINKTNIQKVLEHKEINWPVKNDSFTFDRNKPIFSLNNPDQYVDKKGFLNYSGISGYREGIDNKGGVGFSDDSLHHVYRTYFFNASIVSAYTMLWSQIEPKNYLVNKSRLVLEVDDLSKFIYEPSYGYKDIWNRENSICFEMLNHDNLPKKIRCLQAIKELNQRLKLEGRFEKRMTKCLVITKKKNPLINSDTTRILNGNRMEPNGVALFMDMTNKFPPVIDESNSHEALTISNVSDLAEVRKQLAKYGYSIEEVMREIEMLVLTENDWKKH